MPIIRHLQLIIPQQKQISPSENSKICHNSKTWTAKAQLRIYPWRSSLATRKYSAWLRNNFKIWILCNSCHSRKVAILKISSPYRPGRMLLLKMEMVAGTTDKRGRIGWIPRIWKIYENSAPIMTRKPKMGAKKAELLIFKWSSRFQQGIWISREKIILIHKIITTWKIIKITIEIIQRGKISKPRT